MIYLDYEEYRAKYLMLQGIFNRVLLEKEELFSKALPSAIRYDKDPVQHQSDSNAFEDYAISLEEKKIDVRLKRLRELLDDREKLLEMKEKELLKSQDINDKIYRFRYIDGYSINKISRSLNYSRSQVYRILNEISKRCDKMRKKV